MEAPSPVAQFESCSNSAGVYRWWSENARKPSRRQPQASSVWRNPAGLPIRRKRPPAGRARPPAAFRRRRPRSASAGHESLPPRPPAGHGDGSSATGPGAPPHRADQRGRARPRRPAANRRPAREPAPGKYVAEPKRLQGVQEHDVQVAADAAVLKAIVEHDQLPRRRRWPAARRPRGQGFADAAHREAIVAVRGPRHLAGPPWPHSHGLPRPPERRNRKTSGRASGPRASCRSRRGSGCRRSPPAHRRGESSLRRVVPAVPPADGGRIEPFSDLE